MANIKHFLVIKAPVKTVYKAITEQEGLASWWTIKTMAKPDVGFVNEFNFSVNYQKKMKITKLEHDSLVCWECIAGDREWIGTKLRFELNEKNGTTELMFIHADWADETLLYANCNYNWGLYMKSLKSYCETGTGNPYRDK